MSRELLERLFSEPPLNGQIPRDAQFSPDSQRISYLAPARDELDRLDLYVGDVATAVMHRVLDAATFDPVGVEDLTEEERAQRERRRTFTTGVSGHAWLADSKRLLVLAGGEVHLLDLADGSLRRLTPVGTRQTDVRLPPRGDVVAYVRDGDLYLYDLSKGSEERITDDAGDGVANGLAEFIAQEEMHRFEGYWFSPDGRWLVYSRVDQGPIPTTMRYELLADEIRAVSQRYPFAGGRNADVALWCLDRETGERAEIPWRLAPDDYLARVQVGVDAIWVQAQSRDQRRLVLRRFTFAGEPLPAALEEHQPTWINLHDNLTLLPDSSDYLWTSERDGHARLYHCSADTVRPLFPAEGRINSVVHVDRSSALVLGWRETATEQHLYRVTFDGTEAERLSTEPGWHEAVVSPDGRWWIDRRTTLDQPPELTLRAIGAGTASALAPNALDPEHPYYPFLTEHVTPELGSITAADGQTLNFRLTRPTSFDPARRYPALVHVYGGPGVQRVRNEWPPLSLQLFARAGIAVFELDNRGGANRAKAFEDPLHGRLGDVEVQDQLRGVEYLSSLPWVDGERIGVFGHSYGGYLTLMCLTRQPAAFRAGIAVAPVTDWRLYDTHYTERYLGTPEGNPEGYRASSVMAHVEGLGAPLLVIHGMADDNVLFTHSTKLFKALQDRHRTFEMMTYPGAKHSLQEPDVAIHRYQTMLRFLERELVR